MNYQPFHNQPKDNLIYDPIQVPPNWDLANEYAQSLVIGQPVTKDNARKCRCSHRILERTPATLGCKAVDLGFLGSGYAMLFEFIKYCIYILIVAFLLSGVYNIVTNILMSDCIQSDVLYQQLSNIFKNKHDKIDKIVNDKNTCLASFANMLSLANKKDHPQMIVIQQSINLVTIFIVIILLQFLRRRMRECDELIDFKNITLADYTVIAKNIENDTKNIDYDDKLKNLFMDRGINNKKIEDREIKDITLCYDLDEIEQKQKNLNNAVNEKKIALTRGTDIAAIDEKIKNLEQDLFTKQNEYFSGQTDKFCGVALITFQTEDIKNNVIKCHKRSPFKRFLIKIGLKKVKPSEMLILDHDQRKRVIEIEEAPEPSNVNWEYQNVSTSSKIIRRFVSFICQVLCLGISFLAIYSLQRYQVGVVKSDPTNFFKVKIIGGIISLVIVMINSILAIIIKLLCKFEAPSTETKETMAIAETTAKAQFFNTALVIFLVTLTIKKDFVGKSGLIQNITMLFITSLLIDPCLQVAFPAYYWKKFQQWRARKKYDQNKLFITQKELNLLIEKPEFPIAIVYAQVLKHMFFAAFYMTIIPAGTLISIIELIVLYWVYKYNLINRCCVKVQQSSLLSFQMAENLEYFCIIFASANWLFSQILSSINDPTRNIIGKSSSYTSSSASILLTLYILQVIAGIGNLIIPSEAINKKLWPKLSNNPETIAEYDEDFFDTSYKMENPAIQDAFISQQQKKR